MQLIVGTSGFSYTEWRGSFYPEKLPPARMLSAYAERLPAVEINNTFYRMPQASLFEGWSSQVPEAFRFALKAPRRITHSQKLRESESTVGELLRVSRVLGPRLGPLLFQLPPFLRKDLPLLADFLRLLPVDVRAAFEFRHASWFADDTYATLEAAGAALVGSEVDAADGIDSPIVRTAPFTYVRLRRADYDAAKLAAVRERLETLGVEQAYVFFKHEVLGPSYAQTLLGSKS